jgi:hypothetical protein
MQLEEDKQGRGTQHEVHQYHCRTLDPTDQDECHAARLRLVASYRVIMALSDAWSGKFARVRIVGLASVSRVLTVRWENAS